MSHDHDDYVDAVRYMFESIKWRKWFDRQPWYYRWAYWIKLRFRKENKHLDCPACKRPLVEGKMERFETLVDHVMDPNCEDGPRPLRITYVCRSAFCRNNKTYIFWDATGDAYVGFAWWQRVLMYFNYYNFRMQQVGDAIRH